MSPFFFNDTATTEIYPLSLPAALPISWPTAQEFPLVDPLPSTDSATAGWPVLFARFVGTTRSSDSSSTCATRLQLIHFPNRPTPLWLGSPRGLPVLAHGAATHAQGLRL